MNFPCSLRSFCPYKFNTKLITSLIFFSYFSILHTSSTSLFGTLFYSFAAQLLFFSFCLFSFASFCAVLYILMEVKKFLKVRLRCQHIYFSPLMLRELRSYTLCFYNPQIASFPTELKHFNAKRKKKENTNSKCKTRTHNIFSTL